MKWVVYPLAQRCSVRDTAVLVAIGVILTFGVLPTVAVPPQPLAIAVPNRTNDVGFRREILPLLQANCLPCHNQTRAKAGLNLETAVSMIRGGDTGPALVPGKPAESLLLKTAAHQVEDLVMPPAENKANARNLTPEELGLLSLWISQGGRMEGADVDVPAWKPIAPSWTSSFALALSQDAHTVAVARANRVDIQDVATGRLLAQLSDPALGGAAQRDMVGALAFSPDEQCLATGGFREVRLWRRQPFSVVPTGFVWNNGPALAALFAPDTSRLVLVKSGSIEVRVDGQPEPLRQWPLPTGVDPAAVRLAWSPDSQWLAASLGTGEVRILGIGTPVSGPAIRLEKPVNSLAWWDEGRQLAVALSGLHTLVSLRRAGSPEAPALEIVGDFSGAPDVYQSVVPSGAPSTSVAAIAADEKIRRWTANPAGPAQEVRLAGQVLALQAAPSGPGLAAILADGGAVAVNFGKAPTNSGRIVVDARPAVQKVRVERELALARLEEGRARSLKVEAEASKKAAEEALGKAREKRDGHAKALADQEKEEARQHEIESAATRERDDLSAQLERANQAAAAAENARKEADTAARVSAERDAVLRADAAVAVRTRQELERVLAAAPGGEGDSGNQRLREAFAAAAATADSLEKKSAESRAQAVRSIELLAERAFTAGQRRAEVDRAQSDIPPRRKQAEERLAAAQKALTDLAAPLGKARIALEGSTQDVTLVEKNLTTANESLNAAVAAETLVKGRVQEADAFVKSAAAAAGEESARVARTVAYSSSGSDLLVLDDRGRAARWRVDSMTSDGTLSLGQEHPLAAAGVSEEYFLVVLPQGVVRLNAAQSWKLERTLGGSDSSGPTGPFIDRVLAVAFSPDGRLLATGGGDPSRAGELKLWKVPDGSLFRDFGSLHSDCVTSIAFSTRGDWLATGGADRFAGSPPSKAMGRAWRWKGTAIMFLGSPGWPTRACLRLPVRRAQSKFGIP